MVPWLTVCVLLLEKTLAQFLVPYEAAACYSRSVGSSASGLRALAYRVLTELNQKRMHSLKMWSSPA